MKPLAAIVRSSFIGTRDRDGTFHADEDQFSDVDRYCHARGVPYELLEPELDVKGNWPIEERPSLRAAIEGVEQGHYSGIVVAYLSRLTRSRSGIEIWERVERAGGHVHCAAENLDTSTPSGRFVRDIHLANAVREREEHADRHAKRREATVKEGIWRQHQLPRGYVFAGPAAGGKYRGAARKLVPGPDADLIRKAANDVLAGVPVSRIANKLQMTPAGVRAMLRNRVYLGELREGGKVQKDGTISPVYENLNAHEPILDEATFDALQHRLDNGPRPPRRREGPALQAGLVRCASCGHLMTRGASKVPIYSCAKNHSGGPCPQPAAITLRRLDEYVEKIALAELERLRVSATEGQGLEQAEAAVESAHRELQALVKAVSAAALDERDFASELRERKQAVQEAEAHLRAERARRPALPEPGSGAEVWPNLTTGEKNALLRALIAAVVVAPSGKGGKPSLDSRVRVLRFGAPIRVAENNGSTPGGIVPISVDLNDPAVLRLPSSEDAS